MTPLPLSTPQQESACSSSTAITVAYGDGIGPEIMQTSLRILREAGANLDVETIEIGEAVYRRGVTSGIEASAWDSLRRTGVFYKAPITTPQGGGFKSLNVTVRKTLGLYANVRPTVAYHPFIRTRHPGMDVVIVRENEEDLYAGIEHRQTDQVYQCLKLITRPGSEKIVRYAFEYARRNGRKKVTCFTKDNIMKMTDGLFHQVFDEIAAEYPDLQNEHRIVDIGAALLADRPTDFDVIVTPNLYGDILSDVAAQIAGSVGLAGSANIGDRIAMFEAIHGSAPDIAGKGIANPSGLLHAGVMMLVHLGQYQAATLVHNALLRTLEEGIHTADVYDATQSVRKVTTAEFELAVLARLGQNPKRLRPVSYQQVAQEPAQSTASRKAPALKEMVGVDVFLQWTGGAPDELAARLTAAGTDKLPLAMITNRGVKVWPQGFPETFCTDHWRCRFQNGGAISHRDILDLLERVSTSGFDFIKTENLCTFDGKPGYSLGQGQ
ncbi:MAG: NADP-dependent isocitrate dehydrogenase [Acidobacteria bacterium]|nr:NADP-dependent isocitrate dehydrogenase [Acidobacteriota bacterium]